MIKFIISILLRNCKDVNLIYIKCSVQWKASNIKKRQHSGGSLWGDCSQIFWVKSVLQWSLHRISCYVTHWRSHVGNFQTHGCCYFASPHKENAEIRELVSTNIHSGVSSLTPLKNQTQNSTPKRLEYPPLHLPHKNLLQAIPI